MASRVEYCGTCKADREVDSVEELSDGKKFTLECGHTQRMRIFIVNEEMQISENFSWVEQKNPVEEIIKAVKANDYSKTLTLACSVFEHYGKQILVWHSKKTSNPLSPQNVAKLDLFSVIYQLFSCEILKDMNVKSKMHSIRCLRNSFIHEGYSLKLSSDIAQQVDVSTQDIINCTALLKAEHDKYGKWCSTADCYDKNNNNMTYPILGSGVTIYLSSSYAKYDLLKYGLV